MEIVESTFRNLHNRAKVFDENLDTVIKKQKRIEGDFYTTIDLVREIREKARLLNDKLQRIEKGFNLELYMNRPILKNVYKKSMNIPEIRISDDEDDYYNDDYSEVEEKTSIQIKPSRVVIKSSTNANVVSSSEYVNAASEIKEDEEQVSKPVINGYSSDEDYDPVEEKRIREEEKKKREEKLRQEEDEEDRLWQEEEKVWAEQKKFKKDKGVEENEEGDVIIHEDRAEDDSLPREVNDLPKEEGEDEESNVITQEDHEEETDLLPREVNINALPIEDELQLNNEISSESVRISVNSLMTKEVNKSEDVTDNISISVNNLSSEEHIYENGNDDLSEEELKLKEIALSRAQELEEDEEEERRILEKIERMKQEELLLMQQEE